MNLLPAILIGGPPHAGKSVLAYSLTQTLRLRNSQHYLLRAAPDGEGDWSNEADPILAHSIRFKGQWNQRWVDITVRDVASRPLPLLVDVGGNPTPEQEAIFDQCTHAILLTKDEEQRAHWHDLVSRHSLQVIADLRSDLTGTNALDDSSGAIRGTLAGLERGCQAHGAAFDALVDRSAALFDRSPAELRKSHRQLAPFGSETAFIDLEDLARSLHEHHRYQREDIPVVLGCLPCEMPLALYGRAPIWVYTAIAVARNVTWQFDIRLGWVRTPHLALAGASEHPVDQPVEFEIRDDLNARATLVVRIGNYYLDYKSTESLKPPSLPQDRHVVLDGRMPFWLATALARAYRHCASVDAIQPQELRAPRPHAAPDAQCTLSVSSG